MTGRRGVILVAVVALLGGLAVLAALAAMAAQVSLRGSLADHEQARLRLAVESAAARAAVNLTLEDPGARWVPDGRAYSVRLDDAELTVRVVAEAGRFDLNQGDPDLLQALLVRQGVELRTASTVAQGLRVWRTPSQDTVPRFDSAYAAAGLPQPGRRPLIAPEELRRVIGVDGALYEAVRPYLTTVGAAAPEPAFAPRELLLAMDLPAAEVQQILAGRRRNAAAEGEGGPAPIGGQLAVLVEAHAPSGAALAREIGLALDAANGEFRITGRRPLKIGDARRALEAD
jgi:type II secretory pathway component PulK